MPTTEDRPDWVQCIELAHGRSWCGQRITGFYFAGLDHAAQNGVITGRMVACTRCVDAALKALRAGAQAAQPATPEGMKLVPVEDPRVVDDWAGDQRMIDVANEALAGSTPAAPIGYTWTYQGMQHFTGRRDVAEEIARTATELGVPVEVRPVGVVGGAIGNGALT